MTGRAVRRRFGASTAYLLVPVVGFALWSAYGGASGDLPLVVPNSVAVVVTGITVAVARRYR